MAVRVRFPFRALLMKIKRNEKPTQRKDIKFLRLSVFFRSQTVALFYTLFTPQLNIFDFPTREKLFSHQWEKFFPRVGKCKFT